MHHRFAAILTILLIGPQLGGCGDRAAERQALAAQQQARAEAAARQGLAQVEEVLRAGQTELAHVYASEIVRRYPATEAGRSLAARLPELEARAREAAELRRLRALWTYHEVEDAAAGGTVRTAYIHGEPLAAASPAPTPTLRLVLRRHPAWGQSIYLLMDAGGDFACAEECTVPLVVDGGETESIRIRRAKDNVPPAVFIEDDRELLARIARARSMQLTLPLAAGGQASYRFEVGGLELDRLGPEPD